MFTKVLVALVVHLQLQGVSLIPYLDDILIKAPTFSKATGVVHLTESCLQTHDFVINIVKTVLAPAQWLLHLEVKIDTVHNKVFLSQERQQKILKFLDQVLH